MPQHISSKVTATSGTITALSLSSQQLTLVIAGLLTLFYNTALWQTLLNTFPELNAGRVLFFTSFVLFIAAALSIILTIFSAKYVQKPVLIFILMTAAPVTYFMNTYGVVIDKEMVQNTFETDPAEAYDLLSGKLFLYLLVLGVIPSIVVLRTRIRYRPFWPELRNKVLLIIGCILVIGAIDLSFAKEYSSTFRNNRQIRHLIVPSNYLYYTSRYLAGAYDEQARVLEPVGQDAKMGDIWPNTTVTDKAPTLSLIGSAKAAVKTHFKPVITVVVVGETARAMNFSLNGYERDTNPLLSKQPLINFSQMSSCGTSTAVSVPCMFSDITHDDYDANRVHSRENVLDVLSHAGATVLWRDNNSGCKGVCARVKSEDINDYKADQFCDGSECYDEVMLNGLDAYLNKIYTQQTSDNIVIVLHQKGSHGPAYSKRYPASFNQFTPVCDTADLEQCSREEITNAYDNTILYTDYFLNQVINFLQQNEDRFVSSMIYLSDHGESLGEANVYLHGLPYFMAPEEQTHVPFMTWFSPNYLSQLKISAPCIEQKADQAVSQDNLFHSLLGLLDIQTNAYQPTLDLFGTCRKPM